MFNEKSNPNERFEYVYSQGIVNKVQILVDKATGVNYLVVQKDSGIGTTVLLNADGSPVITPLEGTW